MFSEQIGKQHCVFLCSEHSSGADVIAAAFAPVEVSVFADQFSAFEVPVRDQYECCGGNRIQEEQFAAGPVLAHVCFCHMESIVGREVFQAEQDDVAFSLRYGGIEPVRFDIRQGLF